MRTCVEMRRAGASKDTVSRNEHIETILIYRPVQQGEDRMEQDQEDQRLIDATKSRRWAASGWLLWSPLRPLRATRGNFL